MKKIDYLWALDISMSNTGLVIFKNIDKVDVVFITSIDTHDGKNHQEKLKILADEIIKLREIYSPQIAVSEKGFYRYAASTEAIYKCHGLIAYLLWDIELIEYSPMSIKKGVVGKGNVKKEDVRDYIIKEYPNLVFEDLDQTDAMSVGLFYFKNIGVLK